MYIQKIGQSFSWITQFKIVKLIVGYTKNVGQFFQSSAAFITEKLQSQKQPDRILLIVDDLDRCEGDDLLEIMESIMLLCQDEQINKRLHVCMLVKSHTVEVKLREKYKYLLEDVVYEKEKERLIRENFEKLFDAHLSLPDLKEGKVGEVLRSFLDKLVTDNKKEEKVTEKEEEKEKITENKEGKEIVTEDEEEEEKEEPPVLSGKGSTRSSIGRNTTRPL